MCVRDRTGRREGPDRKEEESKAPGFPCYKSLLPLVGALWQLYRTGLCVCTAGSRGFKVSFNEFEPWGLSLLRKCRVDRHRPFLAFKPFPKQHFSQFPWAKRVGKSQRKNVNCTPVCTQHSHRLPGKGDCRDWPKVSLQPFPDLFFFLRLLVVPEESKQTINFI